jgi:membrane-associated phospholipid phosphatase
MMPAAALWVALLVSTAAMTAAVALSALRAQRPLPRPAWALPLGVAPAGLALLWAVSEARAPWAFPADAGTRALFALVSHAGDPPLLWALALGVGGLLWWRGDRRLAACWALALAGNGLTVRALKALLERARPLDAEALVSISGHSFPSGHASGALVAWGLLGAIALVHTRSRSRALLLLWAFALIGAAVGCARWVIGAHHASDVVAGWLCGGAWLGMALLAGMPGRTGPTDARALGR